MTKIQPFGDRVVIEILTPEQKVGGLVIPTSKERSNRGLVVAVGDGDGVKSVNVNDVVIFTLNTGLNYSTEDKDYRILNIRDIVGKVVE